MTMSLAACASDMPVINKAVIASEWTVAQWFNTERPLRLEDLRGKVVLLHAFQMLCPGCVSHAVPLAERVHRQFADLGVAVIGLHTVFEHHAAMGPVALEAFLHEYRITHPVGVDQPMADAPIPQSMQRYRLRGTPSLMLIDRAGCLRLDKFGRVDELELGMWLGRLLAEDPARSMSTGQGMARESDGCTAEACMPREGRG